MNEDLVLENLVRDALESEGAFEFRPPRRCRLILPWAVSSLLAASVAVVAAFRVLLAPPEADAITDAIAFLSVADGVEIEADDPSEMLLAWQEAPLCL